MAAHLAPGTDRQRLLGALSVAVGLALLTVGALGFGPNRTVEDETPALSGITEPTVLGVVVTRPAASTSELGAPPAVPATFPETSTTADGASTNAPARPRSGATTPTTGAAVIGTPTSVTVPTTRTFPTTTAPTTTEAPPTTETSTTETP